MNTLMTVITERGQTSIPAQIRKQLNLKPGQKLRWQKVADNECRVFHDKSEERAGVWTFSSAQPEGLREGSRRSPGGFWGRRPPGNGLEDVLHPGRGGSTSGFDLAPLRGAGNQATLSGGRSPPGPERPPATLCQPSGLASDQIEMEFVSRALEVSTACPGRHHRPEAAGWYRAQRNRG